jgi:uncharacterized protein YbjT (DUF2867 family)
MKHVLIIGSTGTVGSHVLNQLSVTGAQVRVLMRNPKPVGLPPQVEAVLGDLTLPETLDACLHGIDAVFLVWSAPPAAVAPALERIMKHAQRIVFLSSPHKTSHPFSNSHNQIRWQRYTRKSSGLSKLQGSSGRS